MEADDRKHFKYMKKYFKAPRRGRDRKQAYASAFKKANMIKLEARWREFMRTVR